MSNTLKNAAVILYLLLHSAIALSNNYDVYKAENAPVIDGLGNEYCWSKVSWALINQPFDGQSLPDSSDFYGRYKAVWTDSRLYILMEITDDKLVDNRANPSDNYWEDDCTEFFIDEDHTNEGHECGATAFNAFAYHIAAVARDKNNYLNGGILSFDSPNAINHVIDLGSNCNTGKALNLYDHVNVKITRNGNKYTWELEFKIFNKNYSESSSSNIPVSLIPNKVIGFAIAYCDDDDGSRNNMVGTVPNHNDYSGPYPFYRFTNQYGTLTLIDSVLIEPHVSADFTETSTDQYLTFSPNPVTDILSIRLNRDLQQTSLIEIMNLSGQTLLSQKFETNEISFDVKELTSGMYILLASVSGVLCQQKFIKE